jgi:hypothetical protein
MNMGKLLKFQQEEECDCGVCELVEEYSEMIIDCESVEELQGLLRELIIEAKESGRKEYLMADIDFKLDMLNDSDEQDFCAECGSDDECDCFE